MKINKLGIPAKALLVILAVCIANACENANEIALQESFEERLLLNKKQVKDYVSSVSDLTFSRYSAYKNTEGFFADAKSRLSLIDPQANSEFIAKVEQHYEANKTVEADLQIFEETLVSTLQKGIQNISINTFSNARSEDDYITEEEIMIYFDEFKEMIREEFELAESSIIQEDTLTDDEKIGLAVAITAATETTDIIVDDLVEEIIINDTDENGRVEFRRLGNLFKKTVNLIATVVSRMVRPTLQGLCLARSYSLSVRPGRRLQELLLEHC